MKHDTAATECVQVSGQRAAHSRADGPADPCRSTSVDNETFKDCFLFRILLTQLSLVLLPRQSHTLIYSSSSSSSSSYSTSSCLVVSYPHPVSLYPFLQPLIPVSMYPTFPIVAVSQSSRSSSGSHEASFLVLFPHPCQSNSSINNNNNDYDNNNN